MLEYFFFCYFQNRKVAKIVWNGEYPWDKKRSKNDIAILKLSEPLQFNENVQPACLPNSDGLMDLQYSNQKCVTSGWGNNEGDETNLKLGIAMLCR